MRSLVRAVIILGIGGAAACAMHDVGSQPGDQFGARIAVFGIHIYQATLSKAMAATGVRCRFVPTCSHYAEETIERNGVFRGGWRVVARVIRCGPWTPFGTVDRP